MLERQSVVAARTYLSMQLTAGQRPVREAGLSIRWYFQMGKGIRQLMCRQPCRGNTHDVDSPSISRVPSQRGPVSGLQCSRRASTVVSCVHQLYTSTVYCR